MINPLQLSTTTEISTTKGSELYNRFSPVEVYDPACGSLDQPWLLRCIRQCRQCKVQHTICAWILLKPCSTGSSPCTIGSMQSHSSPMARCTGSPVIQPQSSSWQTHTCCMQHEGHMLHAVPHWTPVLPAVLGSAHMLQTMSAPC